ncbi:MAG: 3-oxoacyl-[acyl-carrier-protein] reductase [Angelakisella sp.]|nr:3-oxoacyl-[acyl-carrier-protein] reductase [Angelakisella sp.]
MLHNKNAVVTGASRGIGRAICLELARQGANVIVNYTGNVEAARQTAEECQSLGVQAFVYQADVSVAAQAQGLIEECISLFGSIDILVNNAGITRDNLMMRMSEEDFDKVLDINLKGAFLCAKAACRPMMKQRFGRIINLSSVVGLRGNAGQANYAASKAGLIGLSKAMAKELATKGVTVNVVAPGFIETDMTSVLPESVRTQLLGSIPMGSLGKAQDVAQATVFFAMPQNGYITGQVLCVDGGMAV